MGDTTNTSDPKVYMEQQVSYAKSAFWARLARTYLPQIPAAVIYITNLLTPYKLPVWVVPVLSLVGALATALDKFFRAIGLY